MTCAGAMITSFSTVRLARITSAMLEVWVIVARMPVTRVSDCDGASEALSSTSPEESAGSMPSSTRTSVAACAPVSADAASASATKERTTTLAFMADSLG